jgi:tetratricopeptide (TPR) repeat protein
MRYGKWLLVAILSLALLLFVVIQIPHVRNRLIWQAEVLRADIKGVLDPVESVPTPALQLTEIVTKTPILSTSSLSSPTPTAGWTATVTPSPTPLPSTVSLPEPEYERQDINNCGPTTLSMYLRYYGWDGDQFTVSGKLRSDSKDRNINVEELVFFTQNYVGWLNSMFRVGGTIEMLKAFLAAGIPVMTEESFHFEDPFWYNDDLWAGHYLLITGYDDTLGTFTVQDSFYGPNRTVTYAEENENWQSFNRVFILIYTPDQEEIVRDILGEHWDVDYNRQSALEAAQAEVQVNDEDAFAWFNLGTNMVYFERYEEAAYAYDQARILGLPQRMLRYQFGPFFAYFHSGRTDEVLTLADYALSITYNAEEAFIWKGWALYRLGDNGGAIENFQMAYEANTTSVDAQYALEYMGVER